MRIKNFETDSGEQNPLKFIEKNRQITADILESRGQGYEFPVHKKIRDIPQTDTLEATPGQTISKQDLFKATLTSMKYAWEQAIEPRIGPLRNKQVETLKQGTDFFTEADTESERVIKEAFLNKFGPQLLQFFGEEANAYTGNLESNILVKIDPIDGTEAFKFGKPDWGIMVGVYQGKPGAEKQVMAGIYFPEMNIVMYHLDSAGTFITDLETGESKEVGEIPSQDDLRNVIVSFWRHSDLRQRGKDEEIFKALDQKKARIKVADSCCNDVLEALNTKGQRIIIYDGDMNQVDYIPYKMLERSGYKIYDWGGQQLPAESPELHNRKVVIVPPGKAGQEIRDLIKEVYAESQ